jgi:hypothetical protein
VVTLTLAVAAGVGVYVAIRVVTGGFSPSPQCTVTTSDGTVTLDPVQAADAATISAVGVARGLPHYAVTIALATAMQESKLYNLPGGDRDSVGLFQQRPSQGWGTAAQITDPYFSTNSFLAALSFYAPNYMTTYLWESAQAVQRSGFPTAYAQWESQAAHMVLAIVNGTAPK